MAHRFHVDDLPESGRMALPAGVARHLDVLGLGPGSEVVLFDGSGREARARVVSDAKGAAEAEVLGVSRRDRESAVSVTLATAVPKGRRMDTLVRMCAELGVARIVPLLTRRSVVKLPEGDDRSGKLERWRKICRAASEQSGRNVLAEIAPAAGLAGLLDRAKEYDLVVILSPTPSAPDLPVLLDRCSDAGAVLLVVGPEGGFTDDELSLASYAGALPARLTRSTLRIETACVTAVAATVLSLGR